MQAGDAARCWPHQTDIIVMVLASVNTAHATVVRQGFRMPTTSWRVPEDRLPNFGKRTHALCVWRSVTHHLLLDAYGFLLLRQVLDGGGARCIFATDWRNDDALCESALRLLRCPLQRLVGCGSSVYVPRFQLVSSHSRRGDISYSTG